MGLCKEEASVIPQQDLQLQFLGRGKIRRSTTGRKVEKGNQKPKTSKGGLLFERAVPRDLQEWGKKTGLGPIDPLEKGRERTARTEGENRALQRLQTGNRR